MNAFCTYCSALKSMAPGNIPAIKRYQSLRIRKVCQAATELGLEFYILSGEFGLISPHQPIPFYDHLLRPEEVLVMVERVAKQLHEYGVAGLVYFTQPLTSSRELLPYYEVIKSACLRAALPFFVVEVTNEAMTA
ncbi:hypothetical protein L0337_27750 [candidate division KSB1 bacterium]|nr:hypothetical protein [candidate division KSB1 bacterium]